MERQLSVDFDWLDREYGDALEKATYAEVTIEVDGKVATEVEDVAVKTVRDGVRLSAYRLALWLTANWWRLRWEPYSSSRSWRLSHNVAAAGGGYIWPDLTISSDGQTVVLDAEPSSRSAGEVIRYLNSFREPVEVDQFEREVFGFIDSVLGRLEAVGVEDSELHTLWEELQNELEDPAAAWWRKLEARLGFDPDEGPKELLETLRRIGREVGNWAMEEVASASKLDAVDDLTRLWKEARPRATEARIGHLPTPSDHEQALQLRPAWKGGEALARSAREGWGLGRGPLESGPFADLVEMSEDVLIGEEGWRETPMPAGFRNGQDGRLGVVIDTGHPNARRFALARIVGDYLYSPPEDRLLPATDSPTARQKFQRAFAHEFLCPLEDLRSYLGGKSPDEEEIESAAEEFQVSPLLVASKLANKGFVDRDLLEQWQF